MPTVTFRSIFKYLSVVLYLVHASPSFSQPSLETLLHLDKAFYVSGEVIWFKLYLPLHWDGHDVAIQTTILDAEGQLADRFFIRSEGRTSVTGYHKTAFDADAGIYEIQFSASAGPNLPEQLLGFYQIPIYNDLVAPSESTPPDETISDQDLVLDNHLKVIIKTDGGNITSRSEVPVTIIIVDQHGNAVPGLASVSVKDGILANAFSDNAEVVTLPISYTINPSSLQREIYTRGSLTTAEGDPLQINVLGGYVASDEKIYYSKSNAEGDFLLNLPDFTGTKIIQFLGFQYERLDLRSTINVPPLEGPQKKLIYNDAIKTYLVLSRMRKKIFQHFESFETTLQTEEIAIEVNALKPDASYSVKKYESFKDLKSFFGELLTPLRFRMDKDSLFTASLYNPNGRIAKNTELNGPPLFIIDGMATRNADWVARLPISAVETVDLFLNAPVLRSYYQAIGVSGVVKISTTLSNLKLPTADASNLHPIVGLQAPANFPVFDPENLPFTNQPFFRPQLYWNPELVVDKQGSAQFSFIQSDDIGEFEIHVVFRASDGRRMVATHRYQVEF